MKKVKISDNPEEVFQGLKAETVALFLTFTSIMIAAKYISNQVRWKVNSPFGR
ncbi:MAG: hypothetical protein ABEI78_02315 [Candidatus Nanohaloarchaea archaeon]